MHLLDTQPHHTADTAHAAALAEIGKIPVFISSKRLEAGQIALLRLKYSQSERDFIPARFAQMARIQGWLGHLVRILASNTNMLSQRQITLTQQLLLPHPIFGNTTEEQLERVLQRLHDVFKEAI